MDSCAFNILTTKSVPHILEMIFFSLDYESFKNCMVVSKTWRNILTNEQFQWRGKSVFGDEIEKDLFNSSRYGKLKEVESILSMFRVDINCIGGRYQATPLCEAGIKGHKELVTLLLNKGANPNKADDKGRTPLHWSAVRGRKNIVHLLLDGGSDPNIGAKCGGTPLHWAAQFGYKYVVKLLIDKGAEVSIADRDGDTALHLAAFFGKKDVVELLLDKGADPKAQNDTGSTPLSHASHHGENSCDSHRDVVKILTPLS